VREQQDSENPPDGAEDGRTIHRPPRDDLDGMSPTANYEGLERRVCPNCRMYFDVGENSEKTFCSDACRHRHEAGVLMADGGRETYQCRECGASHTFDGERVVCYGRGERHDGRVVVKPCGICGDPIRTAEICQDCADGSDTDAFTTNWGSGA
jgi:hypothetical protein